MKSTNFQFVDFIGALQNLQMIALLVPPPLIPPPASEHNFLFNIAGNKCEIFAVKYRVGSEPMTKLVIGLQSILTTTHDYF